MLKEGVGKQRKRKMAKKDALMSKLSKPLTRGVRRESSARAARVPHVFASKVSVSLYPPDLERLDEIKSFMQTKGIRNISDSEALRLACRSVVIGRDMPERYREMQREDGRRARKVS
jgi:hypothetical protein